MFMKKLLMAGVLFGWLVAGSVGSAAQITVGPWTPMFRGVELASGQQQATLAGERNHRVLCLRVDLTDPDIKLFTTPKCANCSPYETLAQNTSRFLEQYDMQVAVNGGFYSSSTGPNDVPEGTPENVLGLAISRGVVVSSADNPAYAATLLFTEDNRAFYVPTNSPATNTTGIYTAISGSRTLLINGVNVNAPTPTDLDPRTAMGLSQDRRYLFLLTIDGRQPGWSDGADFYNTGEWLLRFGAADGINVDGGGSTTMVMEECGGAAQRLNRSSFVAAYGRERIIGHNFGVQAAPLSAGGRQVKATAGTTTANLVWSTDFPGTTRVEYGLTTNYGSSTALDSALVRQHVATLAGLLQGSNYYYRVSSDGAAGESFRESCRFTTARNVATTEVFGMTQSWRYTTNNLDGVNWKSPGYDDAGWMGEGPALLYVLENSLQVAPRNTAMPPLTTVSAIPRTYYFRTHFDFSGVSAGMSLTFSNYIDDGAVFYLNGVELQRLRMPAAPTVITYATSPTGVPCTGTVQQGDALVTCPDVFTVSGPNVTGNLVQGDNVLAVEVHNLTGIDLVFGSALLRNSLVVSAPTLNLWLEDDAITLYWNGEGFTLQESSDAGAPETWRDVPGPVTTSPYRTSRGASNFYRLRN